jgi:hypothetical protein
VATQLSERRRDGRIARGALDPEATEAMLLPYGTRMEIPGARPVVKRWEREFTGDTYTG